MNKTEVFARLQHLVEKSNELDKTANDLTEKNSFNEDQHQACERFGDVVYERFYNLIYENFDKTILDKVEKRIGCNKFFTKEYCEVLYEIYESTPRRVDVYKGFVLIHGLDCFGSNSYFVYDEKKSYNGMFDDISGDELAITNFRKAVDYDQLDDLCCC